MKSASAWCRWPHLAQSRKKGSEGVTLHAQVDVVTAIAARETADVV